MKVYVAAKWEEKPRASALMRALEQIGCRITYDWTRVPDDADHGEQSDKDVVGVRVADLVIVLWHPNLRGGLVEMGVALADDDTAVWAVGVPAEEPCIFFRHPTVRHLGTEDEVLRALVLAKSLRHAELPE